MMVTLCGTAGCTAIHSQSYDFLPKIREVDGLVALLSVIDMGLGVLYRAAIHLMAMVYSVSDDLWPPAHVSVPSMIFFLLILLSHGDDGSAVGEIYETLKREKMSRFLLLLRFYAVPPITSPADE